MRSMVKEIAAWIRAAARVVLRNLDVLAGPWLPARAPRLASWRLMAGVDGRMVPGAGGGAKYALRHGLPSEPGERALAVENDPHEPSRFSGRIPSGYGAGEKRLVWYGTAVVRRGSQVRLVPASYHEHNAERAGLHYDLALGIEPGSAGYEFSIPSGPARGWYRVSRTIFGEKKWVVAALRTRKPVVLYDRGSWKVQVTPEGAMLQHLPYRMIQRIEVPGKLVQKPRTVLIDSARLGRLPLHDPGWVVERKLDGSLATAVIDFETGLAWMRSHRETGDCYLGRLPGLETFASNRHRSPIAVERWLWRPAIRKAVLQGELVHPHGASRVSGLLNSAPEKAADWQRRNGPVAFYAWDILEVNGRNLSGLPYEERRRRMEEVVGDLHHRNPNWHVVPRYEPGPWDEQRFAREVEPLGLPYGEGIVIKGPDGWFKYKRSELFDLPIREILPGSGKYGDSLGRIVVENPETGECGEIGSFELSDAERRWIWTHRDELAGEIIRVRALELTGRGVPRAGVMVGFHPEKSGVGNRMYAELMPGT